MLYLRLKDNFLIVKWVSLLNIILGYKIEINNLSIIDSSVSNFGQNEFTLSKH